MGVHHFIFVLGFDFLFPFTCFCISAYGYPCTITLLGRIRGASHLKALANSITLMLFGLFMYIRRFFFLLDTVLDITPGLSRLGEPFLATSVVLCIIIFVTLAGTRRLNYKRTFLTICLFIRTYDFLKVIKSDPSAVMEGACASSAAAHARHLLCLAPFLRHPATLCESVWPEDASGSMSKDLFFQLVDSGQTMSAPCWARCAERRLLVRWLSVDAA